MSTHRLPGQSCVLVALALTACASGPSDPNASPPYVFHQRYTFAQSADCELLDVDHDGQSELLTFGRTAEGPYALTLSDLQPSGLRGRWQFNLPFSFSLAGNIDLDEDSRDEMCISYIQDDSLFLRVYDQPALERPHPSPRWTAAIAKLTDKDENGQIASNIAVVGTVDVNGDGHPDVIGQINTGFDLTPRGVVALDGQTGAILWSYPMGAWPERVYVQDVTGDGQADIIVGASAPGNGATANGTDDSHSYLIVLDRQGRLRWQQVLGGQPTNVVTRVADVNGDRISDIITILSGAGANPEQISVWDGQTGRVRRLLNSPWSYRSVATADLNADGRAELLIGTDRGSIVALDESLKTVMEYSTSGWVNELRVQDFDRDGKPEVYAQKGDTTVVLDERFHPMAILQEGELGGFVQTGSLESPVSFLIRNSPDVYGFYDLQSAPVISRSNFTFLPYLGMVVLGSGITLVSLLVWNRRKQRSIPSSLSNGSPDVLAWASVAQSLAHELKSPLNAMSLTIQRLMPQATPGHVPSLNLLMGEIERLRHRANAVMRFVDCAHLHKQRLDINTWLKERLAFYQHTVPPTVRLVLTTPDDLPAIQADPEALGMALDNLIENAVAAVDGQGQLTVEARSSERLQPDGTIIRAVVIELMDTGAGIPEATLAKVFEPTFTTKPSGTGFGLPIARHLVEAHGGTLDPRSQEGVGTVVTMTLPIE